MIFVLVLFGAWTIDCDRVKESKKKGSDPVSDTGENSQRDIGIDTQTVNDDVVDTETNSELGEGADTTITGETDADVDLDADVDSDGDTDTDTDDDTSIESGSDVDAGATAESGWFCDPLFYNEKDGCDCECGAWDPDCDLPGQDVYNCDSAETCVKPGTCIPIETPVGWECYPEFYNTLDGCDCECGIWDPDCDVQPYDVLNCDNGEVCVEPGVCEPKEAPPDWQCDPKYYDSGDGCDCDCGIWDPDCNFQGGTHNCRRDEICIDPGVCVQRQPPPTEWFCDSEFFDSRDGCDCECGAWDPDCEIQAQDVFNCENEETCIEPGVCA